jgi:hypothetical protein
MLKSTIVFLVLTCLAGEQSLIQETAESGQPTRLELSVEQATYYVAEPVRLIVALHNDLETPVKGDFYLGLRFNQLWVYYRKVGGQFVRYFPRWLQLDTACVFAIPIEIPAYGKEESTPRLFYDTYSKQLVLAEPGEYEFKATFNLGNDRVIESNIVRVKVVEPPEEERAALVALSDPVLASFVEGDLQLDVVEDAEVEAGAEKAARFLEKYSGSIYAPLVEEQLREVLTRGKATIPGRLTPKLKAIKDSLPDR